MALEIYKEHKPTIVFSPSMPLTNEFYKESNKASLVNSSHVIRNTYLSLGAKNTLMETALTFIIENPDKVHDSEEIVGIVKGAKKGTAIYSVKVITNSDSETKKADTQIFSLRVGKDSTEVSYMLNDKIVELHCQQKGKGITHEIIA